MSGASLLPDMHAEMYAEMPTPQAGLSQWSTSACLASELAHELAAFASYFASDTEGDTEGRRQRGPQEYRLISNDLSAVEIVLPTKRLGTWLTALLAERLGALLPPKISTFDEFIARHCEQLGLAPDVRYRDVLSDTEQELLLLSLIKASNFRHLKPGHEHEIKQFFSELWDWNVGEDVFARLSEALAKDLGFSDESLTTLHERGDELQALYKDYLTLLNERGLTPQALLGSSRSKALAEALAAGAMLNGRWIYIVGFTSLAGAHYQLLAELAKQPKLSLWINQPPDIYSRKNPLMILREAIGGEAWLRQPSQQARGAQSSHVRIHEADDALGEVACAFQLVNDYIKAGCPPSLIAILVTDDKTYGKPLRYFARKLRIRSNLAVTTPLSHTLAGRLLSSLLAFLQDTEAPTKLLGFLSHPYALAHWRTAWPAFADDSDAVLRERLAATLCAQDMLDVQHNVSREKEGEKKGSQKGGLLAALAHSPLKGPHPQAFAAYCRHILELIKAFLRAPKDGYELSEWAQIFEQTAQSFQLLANHLPGAGDEDVGVRASTQENFAAFAHLLSRLTGHLAGQKLRVKEFLGVVREHLLTGDVRSVGEPLKGVQILSVAEARYVPFQVAIVLGCHEGCFPRSLPRDLLVDNYLKSLIGLPGWQLLEAIEDTTFQLLRARLKNLHLLYPMRSGKEKTVRSRFLEPLLVEDKTRLATTKLTQRTHVQGEAVTTEFRDLVSLINKRTHKPARRAGASSRPPDTIIGRPPALGEGALFDLRLQQQSATSLEQFITCPYRFLLGRLDVKELSLPDPDQPQSEGDWLHEVVEAFFTGRARGERLDPPLTGHDLAAPEFEAWAVARLGSLTRRLGPAGVTESPLFLQLQHHSWPALARHLRKLHIAGLKTDGHWLREYHFGFKAGARARDYLDGVELRGSIDAVDQLVGDAKGPFLMVTDFKRKGTPAKHEAISGLAPQLSVYALALGDNAGDATPNSVQGSPLARMILGYYSLLGGHWVGIAAGSEALDAAREQGLVSPRCKDTAEQLAASLQDLWQWRTSRLHEDEAPFRPDPSHCGFCRFEGICRKKDPRFRDAFDGWDDLNQRLGKDALHDASFED